MIVDYKEWAKVNERSERFILGTCKDLSDNKKAFITPVAVDDETMVQMRETFLDVARKVGYLFYMPMYAHTVTVWDKSRLWNIIPAYLLEDFNNWLLANYSRRLPIDEIVPDEKAGEVLDKVVRFSSGSCKDARGLLISTEFNDKYYGYKVKDLIYPPIQV